MNLIDDLEGLPLHTNKVVAIQKAKRRTMSKKAEKAVEEGDIQAVLDSLTGRQKAFVEEYLVDMNATAAVLRAGYQTNNAKQMGFQLMENPAIRISIDALRAQRNKNSDVTKDYVLRGITKAIRMAEESGNLNALLRGHELLARHLGMFIERQEISGPDGKAIEMEQRVTEDVSDFTRKLGQLAKSSAVVPLRSAEGGEGSVS